MAVGQKKAIKLTKRAVKAVRIPGVRGRGSGRSKMTPIAGELPVVTLRVQVMACKNLLAKDKSGTSDPFVVASFAGVRHSTAVVKKTLNPIFAAKDATFDFPIYFSYVDRLGALELVIWDKDMITKDYLGEVALGIDDWFKDGYARGFFDSHVEPIWVDVVSTKANTPPSGSIQVKLGFMRPDKANHTMDFKEVYDELLRLTQNAGLSIMSAPPTQGIGTVRSSGAIPAFADDGLSSDEAEGDGDMDNEATSDYDEDDSEKGEVLPNPYEKAEAEAESTGEQVPGSPTPVASPVTAVPDVSVLAPSPVAVTAPAKLPTSISSSSTASVAPDISAVLSPSPKLKFGGKLPKLPFKRPTLPSVGSSASDSSNPTLTMPGAYQPSESSRPSTPRTPTTPNSAARIAKFPKWKRKGGDYNLNAAEDILGIVMLEIQGATDLPKLKNMTRTGWDMDPFIVISFGKKVFRTRVVRHSLNPVWDEKLLFHVRPYEASFKVQLTLLDWDKLTSNDHIGDASFEVSELLKNAPTKDETTGLYPESVSTANDMQEFKLNIQTAKEVAWEAKHNPVLTVRAKYQPYDALRQQFWRQYLKQYDADDNGSILRLELTSMLDSLGSTLSTQTIDGFYIRHGKNPREDEITFDEVIQCLEEELCRPTSEKKRIDLDDVSGLDTSTPVTPNLLVSTPSTNLALENIDFSGPHVHPSSVQPFPVSEQSQKKESLPVHPTEPTQQPLSSAAQPIIDSTSTRVPVGYKSSALAPAPGHGQRLPSTSSTMSDVEGDDTGLGGVVERVINVKNCPLCHRPRLNSRAEVDIVTHLAVCASQDWARMDRIVVSNFVTASQAQRKWYTKILGKVSAGDYKLGANSANIIVQNRITGQLEEEKMQVYVRLGIRLLYKGAKSRMEGARARRLLKSLSIKQGLKYDSPESAADIPAFIQFHNLNVNEILDPINSFKTFNEFFYRKLKPEARPTEAPDDPTRLISAADCRMMAFETVNEATRLWVKGREFSVARLLGPAYSDQAERYNGGALCIFRLAPQDYHRFHSPVDGTIGPMTYIPGEYYTVNPQAIRTTLDVYGENVRKIVPIDSPTFGRVMAVCVGAMMVGSILTTVNEGDEVKRGQEFGYFAFGGSTIVCLFEKGAVEWDEDLLINGRASLETLVRVGMGIGKVRRSNGRSSKSVSPAVTPVAPGLTPASSQQSS